MGCWCGVSAACPGASGGVDTADSDELEGGADAVRGKESVTDGGKPPCDLAGGESVVSVQARTQCH
jgi:hypothetical protein